MKRFSALLVLSLISVCTWAKKPEIPVDRTNVQPGTSVTMRGQKADLYAGSLKIGDDFVGLAKDTGLGFEFQNKVTVVSFVPSVDTKVCEQQTHILGESKLNAGIDLVTISRDLPAAQARFAKEAKLENIRYYSDYKSGEFGKKTGTLIKGAELLTRGVVVLDKTGKVRYMQFVQNVGHLPDMQKAFDFAKTLL